MRSEHLRAQAHHTGMYGGVGTRPAHSVWKPGGSSASDEHEPVPARFRKLRIRRRRPRRPESAPFGIIMPLILIGFFALLGLFLLWKGLETVF